jgi:hypothetical protein
MATYTGRDGAVTIEIASTETIVGELNTWTVNVTGGETDTSVFGDGWGKTDVGMLGWTGTGAGFYDPANSAQDALWDLLVSGNLEPTLRLYVQYSTTSSDPIKYWKPDTASDPLAGIRVTSFNTGQTHSGVATFDFAFSGSGPVLPVQATVP